MKKRILIMACIPVICLLCVYTWFIYNSNQKRNEFFQLAANIEDLVLIRNDGAIGGYSEEELPGLSLVEDGSIPLEEVRKDRKHAVEITHKLLEDAKQLNAKPKRTIQNESIVKYGFVADENTFLNIYENNTALIGLNGKYYGYEFENAQQLEEKWKEYNQGYYSAYEDPYYKFD